MPKVSLIAYEAQYNLWEYRNHLENGLQPRTVLIPWHFTSLDCLSIRFNEETTDHSSPLQRGTPYLSPGLVAILLVGTILVLVVAERN